MCTGENIQPHIAQRRIRWVRSGFSVSIPYWGLIHFEGAKCTGTSKHACFRGLAHYDRNGRCISTSIRNFIGELNHYSCNGRCIGYSRKSGICEITHYSHRGKRIACSYSILGILFIHYCQKT